MDVSLSKMAYAMDGEIFVLELARPKARGLTREKTEELLKNDNWDDWLSAMNESSSPEADSLLFHWDGQTWQEIDLPSSTVLRDIWIGSSGETCMVGAIGVYKDGIHLTVPRFERASGGAGFGVD